MPSARFLPLGLVPIAFLSVSTRADATCHGQAQLDATVTANRVEVRSVYSAMSAPPYISVHPCPDADGLLRTNVNTGEVVRVADVCGPDASYIDQCVPAGQYRYGFSQPNGNAVSGSQCSGHAGCSERLYINVAVTSALDPACSPDGGSDVPVAARPWTDCPDSCFTYQVFLPDLGWRCSQPWWVFDADAQAPITDAQADGEAGADVGIAGLDGQTQSIADADVDGAPEDVRSDQDAATDAEPLDAVSDSDANSDASVGADVALVDAHDAADDTTVPPDAAMPGDDSSDSGCGCRVAPRPSERFGLLAALGGLALMARLRRPNSRRGQSTGQKRLRS
jgi:hypothetical protein